jgi:zinc D-Ala-D-Ala carboxypeptidase
MNWADYPNFSAQEFDCSHCGQNEMKPEFMAKLQKLRETYGSPMRVTSGYRCPQHHRGQKSPPWRTRKRSSCRHRVQGEEAHRLLKSR